MRYQRRRQHQPQKAASTVVWNWGTNTDSYSWTTTIQRNILHDILQFVRPLWTLSLSLLLLQQSSIDHYFTIVCFEAHAIPNYIDHQFTSSSAANATNKVYIQLNHSREGVMDSNCFYHILFYIIIILKGKWVVTFYPRWEWFWVCFSRKWQLLWFTTLSTTLYLYVC